MLDLQVVFKAQPLQMTAPPPVKGSVVALGKLRVLLAHALLPIHLPVIIWLFRLICMLSADCHPMKVAVALLTFLVDLADMPRTTCSPGAVDAPSAERGYQPKTGEAAARTAAAGPQAEAPGCHFAANEGLQWSR